MLKDRFTRSLAAVIVVTSMVALAGVGALPPGVSWT